MNKKNNSINRIGVFILFFTGFLCFAQEVGYKPAKESFEKENVLANFEINKSSFLSISNKHHQFGSSSLLWEWKGEGYFKTSNFKVISKKESPLKYGDHFPASPTLIMSLYNEVAQNEEIRISYEKSSKESVWFTINLNFTGWRTIWVPFYEMNGTPPKKGADVFYDTFKVSCNSTKSKGKLYIDDIVYSQYQDDRHSFPDVIVPFIKRDLVEGEEHWMPLIRDLKRLKNVSLKPVSNEQKEALLRIKKRIDDSYNLKITNENKSVLKAKKEFEKLHLQRGETILGPPLTFKIEQVYFDNEDANKDNFIEVQDFGKSLKKIANFYYQENDVASIKEIEELFITASKYFLDQGWQEGSSGGTRHHIGYNVRELTDAFYLMKEPLKNAGLLNEIGNSLQWIFNLGKVLGNESEFEANIDYYNTQSFYHLKLIFMSDDIEKQSALLTAYSNYISKTLAQENEIGVFKIDGTSWHHNGHYPAYGLGAFTSIPPVIYTLSGTPYRIDEGGHKNFKKAFLTTRLYSQLLDYGFGNSGRHPLEDNSINSLKNPFLLMARSGNPEETSDIDKEIASAYLRLWGEGDSINKELFEKKYAVTADILPGYHVLPYAATSIHRRKDWAAIIKGYSKYVWSSEIYVDANRYGRYQANGSIQINNKGGDIASGFKQEGWDWNRYPGTTIVYLPFKELEPNTPLLMYRSNETFAGAVRMGDNGVFGMKLNESKGSNADGPERNIGFSGKLKANKSVFSFGKKLICIGTAISSIDTKNPVQTNLFQNYLSDTKMPIYTSGNKSISDFPYHSEMQSNGSGKRWLIDAYRNGYCILSPNPVAVQKQTQDSFMNTYSVRNGTSKKGESSATKGDFASAWIDHGVSPNEGAYQYVIYPELDKGELDSFQKIVENDATYQILRADTIAHIVQDNETTTTGFVVFDSNKELNNSILKSVSTPSLLMIKKEAESLTISAVQPDLNFSEVENKSISGYSLPVEMSITLVGNWKLEANSNVKSITNIENNTVITLECRHGFTNQFNLIKR